MLEQQVMKELSMQLLDSNWFVKRKHKAMAGSRVKVVQQLMILSAANGFTTCVIRTWDSTAIG